MSVEDSAYDELYEKLEIAQRYIEAIHDELGILPGDMADRLGWCLDCESPQCECSPVDAVVNVLKRPLSFLLGRDHSVLETLIDLHAVPSPRILDVTYGKGVSWKLCKYRNRVIRMDLNPEKGLDYVGDFRDLSNLVAGPECPTVKPGFRLGLIDNSIDVLVFDPPHLTDIGKNSQLNGKDDRYGLDAADVHGVKDISHYFVPFLTEAKRVLSDDGIILAKIADQVHGGAKRWHQVQFIQACWEVGLTPCDQIVKADPAAGKLMGLWKTVKHTRNAHCYWIVVRKGPKCHRDPRYA